MTVEICKGLECLGCKAFKDCEYFKCINIPSMVKLLDDQVFHGCEQLKNVILREGLEKIGGM